MMKKYFLVAAVFLSAVLLSGCTPKTQPSEEQKISPTSMPNKSIEDSVKEKPYVSLVTTPDGHWVNMEIKRIGKQVSGLEYELTYFADMEGSRIERGVSTGSSPVELKGASDYSKKILFGSASCTTGVCKYKYDENVSEGKLMIKLVSAEGTNKYESAYRIQKGKEGKDGLSTGDGIFNYSANNLSLNTLYLTTSTFGLPASLPEGKVAKSIPYSIFPAINIRGEVSIKSTEDGVNIMMFDGTKWLSLESSAQNGIVTASSPKSGIFVLVK